MFFSKRDTDIHCPAAIVGGYRRQQDIAKAQQALIDALAEADHSQAVSALAELRLALREAHSEAKHKGMDTDGSEWQLLTETEDAVDALGKRLDAIVAANGDYSPQRAA